MQKTAGNKNSHSLNKNQKQYFPVKKCKIMTLSLFNLVISFMAYHALIDDLPPALIPCPRGRSLPGAKLLLIPCESLHKKQAFSSTLSTTGFPVPSWVAGATRFLKKGGAKNFSGRPVGPSRPHICGAVYKSFDQTFSAHHVGRDLTHPYARAGAGDRRPFV